LEVIFFFSRNKKSCFSPEIKIINLDLKKKDTDQIDIFIFC
jgi:hypothetical protein